MLNRPASAVRIAHGIRIKMHGLWEKMEPSICRAKRTGVTSDNLSEAAVPLVAEIKALSQMPDDEALQLAWDVSLDVIHYTMRSIDVGIHAEGYGDRPSDDLLDDLLCEFMEIFDEQGGMDEGLREEAIQKLEDQAKKVGQYMVDPWFPKTLANLEGRQSPRWSKNESDN
jgi:hypothetical protein